MVRCVNNCHFFKCIPSQPPHRQPRHLFHSRCLLIMMAAKGGLFSRCRASSFYKTAFTIRFMSRDAPGHCRNVIFVLLIPRSLVGMFCAVGRNRLAA
jgi:hypothetical protein